MSMNKKTSSGRPKKIDKFLFVGMIISHGDHRIQSGFLKIFFIIKSAAIFEKILNNIFHSEVQNTKANAKFIRKECEKYGKQQQVKPCTRGKRSSQQVQDGSSFRSRR